MSIEKEQGVKQSFSNTQQKANLLGAILQVATVLYLGSLRPEFYTDQNLIVVEATVFSKT